MYTKKTMNLKVQCINEFFLILFFHMAMTQIKTNIDFAIAKQTHVYYLYK